MYYEEPYQRRKSRPTRKRRRRSFGQWLAELCLRLIALILTLAILGAGMMYALPVSLFAVEPEGADLSLTDGLPASRANILLLGLDAMRQNAQRSDAVLIASIGYGKLKLTSVLRDTIVDIPGHGSGKLNAAYAYGGPELVMKTLNENFNLNSMHWLAVDFTALADVVDALGGVDLAVTDQEAERINRNISAVHSAIEAAGYSAQPLSQGGESVRLNGVQALFYARIRKLDSDFVRTRRQRALLNAMLERIRGGIWNPLLLRRLLLVLTRSVDTNMSMVHLISLGEKALAAGSPEQLRLPVDGSYTDDGSSLRIDDLQANIDAFRAFAYE